VRIPKPYWKKSHKCWYVNLNGHPRRLDPNEAKAKELYKKLLAEDEDDQSGAQILAGENATVHDLLTEFLAWTELHREPGTLGFYQEYLSDKGGFADFVGAKLRVRDVKPYHVTRWLDKRYPKASSTTHAGAVASVKRAFKWASDEGYIHESPIAKVKRPERKSRGEEAYLLPDQWVEVLKHVKNEPFRDLITVLKETGCRPQEIKKVERRHFDEKSRCWSFAKEESKGKKHPRTVHLNEKALKICKGLAAKRPTGPLFLNTKSRPWTIFAMNCACRLIEKKVDFEVFPYAIRHTFATQAIIEGVDLITIATLMGHRDLTMLSKIYQHVHKNMPHLKAALEKATKVSEAVSV
jgi:integrase/recombinase XerC